MILKTLQWNIGGGKIRNVNTNPESENSYSVDGMEYIFDLIKKYSPHIITLEESHANDTLIQAKLLADKLCYPDFTNDVYDQSHVETGWGLGQSIISRFPISNHNFNFFFNPKYEVERPNGGHWTSHDKGLTSCRVKLENGIEIVVMALHMIPFKSFNVDPLSDLAGEVRRDVVSKILKVVGNGPFILQGDFNFNSDSISELLPGVIDNLTHEVPLKDATTPKGRKYDHIVYRGLNLKSTIIDSKVLTDHYPIVVEFEI